MMKEKDKRQLKRIAVLKRKHLGSFFIFLFIAAIGLIMACDSPDTGGCGNDDPTPTPTVTDLKPLIPDSSWDCGMPEGIPSPESGALVFEAKMTIGDSYDVGQTQYGYRNLFVISGGTVSGPKIDGDILNGGMDYQLTLSNGAMEIDQVNVIKTSDGSYIYWRTCGASADQSEVRIVPDFEAANDGAYSFLNTGKYAGVREVDSQGKTITLKVYDVSNVVVDPTAPGAVKVIQPHDAPDQSFACQVPESPGTRGDLLFKETVDIDPALEVGESKNGLRKIAPITGGSLVEGGQISGKVLFGGADYQLFTKGEMNVNGIFLDARYIIQADDGELILIRNCGPVLTPAPSFETRKNGDYGYLNDAQWISAFPMANLRQTQVNVRIFESE